MNRTHTLSRPSATSKPDRFPGRSQPGARTGNPLRSRGFRRDAAAACGVAGEPDYRSSARNRLGSGGMMRSAAGCPAVARAGEVMAAC